jgi:hypothetical protein
LKKLTSNYKGLIARLTKLSIHVKTGSLLIALFLIYGLSIHFFDGVLPIHEWRKTDSLSIAWNYYKGASFWEPQTNFISSWGNRYAAAEFPIIYYLVGMSWKIFGYYEWIAKLISFSTLFGSFILFSHVVNHFFQNQLKSLIFIGIIFSSPVLLFYADSLLPNVFSFAFLLYSIYFLFKFITKQKKYGLVFFTFFLSLAILIKVTVLIVILTFSGGALFYYFFNNRAALIKNLTLVFILAGCLVFAFIVTYLWYAYALSYNEKHHSILFSTSIRPIWEVDAQKRKEIWSIIWKYQFNMLYHSLILVPSILYVVYLAIKRKISMIFIWLLGLGFLGLLSYFMLWFCVFDVHDYYLIEALFYPLIILFICIYYFENVFTDSRTLNNATRILFISLIFLHAVSYTQIANGKSNIITKNTFLVSRNVGGNWNYFFKKHRNELKKLQDQKLEIQKIIQKEDTVLCMNDYSPNTQLYTIERLGYSNFNFHETAITQQQVQDLINKGGDYMLVIGNEKLNSAFSYFAVNKVYENNPIYIFDLKSFKKRVHESCEK